MHDIRQIDHFLKDALPMIYRTNLDGEVFAGAFNCLSLAPLAVPQPPSRTPRIRLAAPQTNKARCPSHPRQVCGTVLICRKPLQKFLKVTWIWRIESRFPN